MIAAGEQAIVDFCTYPPVGEDDWQYAFATARIRAMETQMLSRGIFQDMAKRNQEKLPYCFIIFLVDESQYSS